MNSDARALWMERKSVSSQFSDPFILLLHESRNKIVWSHFHRQEDQRICGPLVGSGGCEGDTHTASHEFDSQRSLEPCCLSSASGWWLVSWYTLPVSAYCILITRSKQASWSSFQAAQWQPTLCKSLHAESLLGLSSVLLWDILLKIKKFSWVCEDAKVLTWYSDVIKT